MGSVAGRAESHGRTATVSRGADRPVKARIDGQLDQVGFTEGQDVKVGQMLAHIDPRTLKAQLEQAQAQRAKDAALLANARIDLERYTKLIAEDAATQQQLDTQTALVAQLEAASSRRRADRLRPGAAELHEHCRADQRPSRAVWLTWANIVHAADAGGWS